MGFLRIKRQPVQPTLLRNAAELCAQHEVSVGSESLLWKLIVVTTSETPR